MTTSTGKPRGRPKGCVKTGGRVAGGRSLDKGQRQLVTAQTAGDILAVYQRLGGEDFLYRWAKTNQTAFINSCLSRLMPPMPKDDDTGSTFNTQINVNSLSERDAALRVAFALAKALHDDPSLAIDVTPSETIEPDYISPGQWTPPTDAPDMPEPVDDDRARWAAELPLTPEERADNALVRETKQATLATYAGSSAEQGGGQRQHVQTKATAKQLCSRLSRRGRDLL